MLKGKGKWVAILGALGLGALAFGLYDGDSEGVLESGTLLGEGDIEKMFWRTRRVKGEPGFADVFIGETSLDREVWNPVAEGTDPKAVKALTLEKIALLPGFSG